MAGNIEDELLSEVDFKEKVHNTLQKKGILDSLKSQLRCAMIKELQLSLTTPPIINHNNDSLLLQISNDIIVSHLNSHGYEYTLSTFFPEASINSDKTLSTNDLIQFLHIPSDHPIVNALVTSTHKGLLLPLIESVSLLHVPKSPCSTPKPSSASISVQTEHQTDTVNEMNVGSSESRILTIQRDLESRNKRMMDAEIKRFKEKEMSIIRMEEKNRYLKQISKIKSELEEQYKNKIAVTMRGLVEERERLKRREADNEECLYSQRQTVLNEMELLKTRQVELKRQAELNRRTTALEREKVKSLQDVLKSKDNLLSDLKKQYEEIATSRIECCVAEFETKLLQEQQTRKQIEQELEDEQQAKRNVLCDYDKLKNDIMKERDTNKSLHHELANAINRQNDLLKHIAILEDKRHMVRTANPQCERKYDNIERNHEEERHDGSTVTELKRTVSGLECMIDQMKVESSTRLKEHDGLEQLLVKTSQEKMALHYDKKQSLKEIALKTESCVQLQNAFDQQTVILQSAYREIEDLQEQVNNLHELLVPGGTISGNRRNKINKKRVSPRKHSPLLDLSSSNVSPLLTASPVINTFSDSSALLLAEAKATFVRLENEAKGLEQTYGFYQPPLHTHLFQPTTVTMATVTMAIPLSPSSTISMHSMISSEQSLTTPIATPPLDHSTTPPLTYHSVTPTIITTNNSITSYPLPLVTSSTQYNIIPSTTSNNSSLKQPNSSTLIHQVKPVISPVPELVNPCNVHVVSEPVSLWKRDTQPTSNEEDPIIISHVTPVCSHVTSTLSNAMTVSTVTVSHVTVPQQEQEVITHNEQEVTHNEQEAITHNEQEVTHNEQEVIAHNEWIKKREEKMREREEKERIERENEQRQLKEMEEGENSQEEGNSNGLLLPLSASEETVVEESSDVLDKYIQLILQQQQQQPINVVSFDKENSLISLATKSDYTNDNDSTDTFEEW